MRLLDSLVVAIIFELAIHFALRLIPPAAYRSSIYVETRPGLLLFQCLMVLLPTELYPYLAKPVLFFATSHSSSNRAHPEDYSP